MALLRRFQLEAGDVALFFKNSGDLALQLGIRHGEFRLARARGVAQAGEHICDGIGHFFWQELGGRLDGLLLLLLGFPHCGFLGLVGEGHAKFAQQRLGFFV